MLTPSVSPPRPSTESSKPVEEGLCGPDLKKGISTDFNNVGGIYNEVQALIYQHMWPRTFAAKEVWSLCKQSLLCPLRSSGSYPLNLKGSTVGKFWSVCSSSA